MRSCVDVNYKQLILRRISNNLVSLIDKNEYELARDLWTNIPSGANRDSRKNHTNPNDLKIIKILNEHNFMVSS